MLAFLDGPLFPSLMSPERKKAEAKARKERMEASLANAIPWNPKQKHQHLVCIKAETYKVHSLFPVKPWNLSKYGTIPDDPAYFVSSRGGRFRYVETLLPRGTTLKTWHSSGSGYVAFDADVVIPTLYDQEMNRDWQDKTKWSLTHPDVWMSFTPAEIWSLRGGTSLAKGHTVIAGLGLGWQLEQVLARKQVKQVTLVEKSRELLKWILPKVLTRLPRDQRKKLVKVHTGNAYTLVPTLTADVALIDIYTSWGGNEFVDCPNIKKVWVWGSAQGRDGSGYGYSWLNERGPW